MDDTLIFEKRDFYIGVRRNRLLNGIEKEMKTKKCVAISNEN